MAWVTYDRQWQMACERVDERLVVLSEASDSEEADSEEADSEEEGDSEGGHSEDVGNDSAPTRRKLQTLAKVSRISSCHSDLTYFLEAIRPRPPVSSRNPSNARYRQPNRKAPALRAALSTPALLFIDLPLDVFMEIASHLYPSDLLHLSRTSGVLRKTLMSRKSRAIWTTSFNNVIDIPPCPADLSEPLYTALVFDLHCFACGNKYAYSVDYALRTRMCASCYRDNVIEGTAMLQSIPKDYRKMVGEVVLMLVSSADTYGYDSLSWSFFSRINPVSHLEQDFYFKPELEAMLRLFWPLPKPEDIADLKPFIKARVNYIMERHAHAVLLRAWDRTLRAADETHFCWDISEFKKTCRDGADCPRHHDLESDEVTPSHDPKLFEYVSQDALTDLRRYPPSSGSHRFKERDQLVNEMHHQVARESAARKVRTNSRYTLMAGWHARILADYFSGPGWNHAELQNAYDGARVWEYLVLEDDARARLDTYSIGSLSDDRLSDVFESIRDYRGAVMECLSTTLQAAELAHVEGQGNSRPMKFITLGQSKGKQGWPDEPRDALRRPTAFFRCGAWACNDETYAYAWPNINAHWREKHPDQSVWTAGTPQAFKADVWEDGIEVVDEILAALVEQGMSHKHVDKVQLDQLITKGRVFCACRDPTMATPDKGLTWEALVNHVSIHLNASRLRILKTEDPEGPVWIDDHEVASCIKYLPKGADTSQATMRVRAPQKAHIRFADHLSTRISENSKLVCALCAALTPKSKIDLSLALPESVDAVLYHMRAKHGLKRFFEKNVEFWGEWAFEATPSSDSKESAEDDSSSQNSESD